MQLRTLLTLNRHHNEHNRNANHARPARLQEQQIANDQRHQRCRPHRMDEHRYNIEAIDIVRQQIHHFADGRFTECRLRQAQRLPVDHTANGYTHLHAIMEATDKELIYDQPRQTVHEDNAACIVECHLVRDLWVLAEIGEQLAEQKGLRQSYEHIVNDANQTEQRILSPEGLHDGRNERRSAFFAKLAFPASVMPCVCEWWKKIENIHIRPIHNM